MQQIMRNIHANYEKLKRDNPNLSYEKDVSKNEN